MTAPAPRACPLSRSFLPALAALVSVHAMAAETPAGMPFGRDMTDTMTLMLAPTSSLPVSAAGCYAGAIKGTLVVAGGAASVGPGGDLSGSAFLDTVYVLETGKAGWRLCAAKLPQPAAFGAAVPCEDGLVLLGGWTASGPSARVLRIGLQNGEPVVSEDPVDYPPLPVPLALCGARSMDGAVYAVGGCTNASGGASDSVYMLSLARGTAGQPAAGPSPRTWTTLSRVNPGGAAVDPLGNGLLLPVVEVRKDEFAYKNGLLVFGGWEPRGDGGYAFRRQVTRYVPGDKSRNGWISMRDLPEGLAPLSAVPVGPAHVLLHARTNAVAAASVADVVAAQEANAMYLYHTFTATWVQQALDLGPRRGELLATPAGFAWLDLTAAGTTLWNGSLKYTAKGFGWLNYTLLILYMLGMVGIGEYFRRREKSSQDFFLGGRKIPWWAAGLSIWATGVSAISYMAIPAKTYAFDWSYVSLGIWPVLTTFIAAYAFIPLLRRLEILSITQYMEMRFNRSIRIPITILTIVGGILGRLSTVLLLPSLALSAVTGWPVWVSIVTMGVVTTAYTVAGGMNAVVWTDVAQTIVMFGGVILSFALIVTRVEGGLSGVVSVALDHQKLRCFDFAWDFSVATFWVFILWAIVDLWGKIGQEGLQRAFSTKDVKSARRAMMTCAWVSIPGTILFYGIGTALFAFYAQHPARLNPNLQTDGIFPLFIMQQLPAGLGGVVIAGIFAAAMSTLSGMNSAATVVVQDFCDYFAPKAADARRLRAARWVTLLYGAMATGGAWFMSTWNISSIWDTFSKVMSLIGGGLGCVMVLGLLTRRTNTIGVWAGTLVGTVVLWCIEIYFKQYVSFFIYGTIATAVACVVGYVVSLLTGGSPKNLEGLTLWTLRRDKPD